MAAKASNGVYRLATVMLDKLSEFSKLYTK